MAISAFNGARNRGKAEGLRPAIAILTCDNFDEWLDGIGVSVESFLSDLVGAWIFNYAAALDAAGARTVLFITTGRVRSVTRVTHEPTGATVCLLPASRAYRLTRRLEAKARGSRIGLSALRLARQNLSTPLFTLRRELQRERCECILVERYDDPRFDLTVALGRAMHLPVFGIFTSVMSPTRRWTRPFRSLAIRSSAGIISASGREADRVAREYRLEPERIGRINYPVDQSVWHPEDKAAARSALGVSASAKVAAYHGTIEIAYKGLDVLIEGWRLLCKQLPDEDLRLFIIGTGADAERFADLLRAEGLRGITWVNEWIHDRAKIRRYLAAADVYAFPSRLDVFGVSVMEAMSCGLPVAVSPGPDIPKSLVGGEDSGGILIPLDDAPALAAALRRIFESPALAAKFSARSLELARSTFSMPAIGSRLRAFLLR